MCSDHGEVSLEGSSSAVEARADATCGAPSGSIEANAGEIGQELARIYEADAASLHRYAVSLTQQHESAQDAVQEVFLRYYIARREGQRFQNPRAWLFRVLHNHVFDGLRMSRTKREVGIESMRGSPDTGQDPEGDYRRGEMARRLSDALASRELECVCLRAEGLRYEKIAVVLSVRSGTVGAMLARAHKKIRKSLRHAGYLTKRNAEALRELTPERTRYAS